MTHPEVGKLITTPQHRDAIHVAIAPVIAGEADLKPGDHIGLVSGSTDTVSKTGNIKCIGIVDPFLDRWVAKGEGFWMFLYPGSITSLRHDWTHPDFREAYLNQDKEVGESEAWIRKYSELSGLSYPKFMEAIAHWITNQSETYSVEGEVPYTDPALAKEFWGHYQVVTGYQQPDYYINHEPFRCHC